MKLEGRQYTNREDLGGQGLFQTSDFNVYRGNFDLSHL